MANGPEINTSHLNVLISIFGKTPWTAAANGRAASFSKS